jgi:hypothetical protein
MGIVTNTLSFVFDSIVNVICLTRKLIRAATLSKNGLLPVQAGVDDTKRFSKSGDYLDPRGIDCKKLPRIVENTGKTKKRKHAPTKNFHDIPIFSVTQALTDLSYS